MIFYRLSFSFGHPFCPNYHPIAFVIKAAGAKSLSNKSPNKGELGWGFERAGRQYRVRRRRQVSGWLEDGRLTGRRACAAPRPTPLTPSLATYVTLTLYCTTPSLKPQSLARLASIKPASTFLPRTQYCSFELFIPFQ